MYALVNAGSIVDRRPDPPLADWRQDQLETVTLCLEGETFTSLQPRGGETRDVAAGWVPILNEGEQDYDPATQDCLLSVVVEADRVRMVWSVTPRVLTVGDLLVYANSKQWALATSGYTYTSSSGTVYPAFSTSVDALTLMGGKMQRLAMPNPPAAFTWQFDGVTFIDIPAADFVEVTMLAADFVQSTFDKLKDVVEQILAGTLTTLAGIDAAGWPPGHN